MQREEFLTRVRQAAVQGRAHRIKQREIPPQAGYVGGGDDLAATLQREIIEVGGQCELVDTLDGARHVLIRYLGELQPRSALCWQHELLDQLQLAHLLDYARIRWHDHASLNALSAGDQRAAMLAADLGISSADYAVAESGTLVVGSQAGQERMVSLLPKTHVAIVAESRIVPDLFDLFEEFEAQQFEEWPSNVAFITGPSKTGDIELQLTTGVHGPGDWRVIVVRNH